MTAQYRIHGITVAQRPGGDYGVTLDLNSIQLEHALRLQQQLGKSSANSSGGRTTYLSGLPLLGGNVEPAGGGAVSTGGLGVLTRAAARFSTGFASTDTFAPGGWAPSSAATFAFVPIGSVDQDPSGLANGQLPAGHATQNYLYRIEVYCAYQSHGDGVRLAIMPSNGFSATPGAGEYAVLANLNPSGVSADYVGRVLPGGTAWGVFIWRSSTHAAGFRVIVNIYRCA